VDELSPAATALAGAVDTPGSAAFATTAADAIADGRDAARGADALRVATEADALDAVGLGVIAGAAAATLLVNAADGSRFAEPSTSGKTGGTPPPGAVVFATSPRGVLSVCCAPSICNFGRAGSVPLSMRSALR